MENIHKKFIEGLVEAEKLWIGADHLIYVTYPVVKDEKLLLKAFENIYNCIVMNISIILKFEYLYKRINLSKDKETNLNVFFNRCAKRYNFEESELKMIKDLLFIGKKHKESSVEFSKGKNL